MMAKPAGLVVLYNPENDVLDNIRTYIDGLDVLYVVDNSDKTNLFVDDELKKNPKVVCLSCVGNLGIAKALNIGAQKAIEQGYQYLFTVDQDSRAQDGMISSILECFNEADMVGIASPYHAIIGRNSPRPVNKIESVSYVMTSGNILNLDSYKHAGPFLDELFIDSVDHEYCLRLRSKGYSILRVNDALLAHSLGKVERKLGLSVISHNPLRNYYITRNSLHVAKIYRHEYPDFFRFAVWSLFKNLLKVVLFESCKIEKLRMIVRGYRDYRKGILGKYNG